MSNTEQPSETPKKVVTLKEASDRFLNEGVIVIPDEVWKKVASGRTGRRMIGCNIGIDNGPIFGGDHDPDDD
jgi:hypothetical protein